MSYRKTEGEHKDGICQCAFRESSSVASGCVLILKVPLRLKLQDKELGFFHRPGVCFRLLSVWCPGGGGLPSTHSHRYSPMGPRDTSHPPNPPQPDSTARQSKGVLLAASAKTGTPDVSRSSTLEDPGAERVRGRA